MASSAAASISQGTSRSRRHPCSPLRQSGAAPRSRFPATRDASGTASSSGIGGASAITRPFGPKKTATPSLSVQTR
jgi:hypothetical protein